jgi:hypothetical protein
MKNTLGRNPTPHYYYFMLLRMACSVDSEARVTVYAVQYFLALYFGI